LDGNHVGRASGGEAGADAGPVDGVLDGGIQRVDLGKELAARSWQTIEGAIGIDFVPCRQRIREKAGDAKRRQQTDPSFAIGARLQTGAFSAKGCKPLADRGTARRRLGAHEYDDDGDTHHAEHARQNHHPAGAPCVLGRSQASRHATDSSMAADDDTGGGPSVRE
jgi:hypothetical protein